MIFKKSYLCFITIILCSITGTFLVLYLHWDSMLISFLAKRNTVLPFTDVESLLRTTDYQIVVCVPFIHPISNLACVFSEIFHYRSHLELMQWMISDCLKTQLWKKHGKRESNQTWKTTKMLDMVISYIIQVK